MTSLTMDEATVRVRNYCDRSPACQKLRAISERHAVPCYMSGGAIRDILLDRQPVDLDLFLGGKDREAVKRVIEAFRGDYRPEPDGGEPAIELRSAENIHLAVRQFDFTIHTFLYDLQGRTLSCETSGLSDLNDRCLRWTSAPIFFTSPQAFTRVFRLALTLELKIDDAVLQGVRDFGGAVHLAPPDRRPRPVIEVLRIFSSPVASRVLGSLIDSRILEELFPFLLAMRYAEQSSSIDRNARSLVKIEQVLSRLSEPARKEVLSLSQFSVPALGDGSKFQMNELGLIRLALLFGGVGEALQSLQKDAPSFVREPEFIVRSEQRLIWAYSENLSAAPAVTQIVRQAVVLQRAALEALGKVRQGCRSVKELLPPSGDPRLRRQILLTVVSLLLADEGGDLKDVSWLIPG